MASWERKALTFISQTSEWDRRGDVQSFLSFGISLLRELTGAYMSLKLDFEDTYTARVKDAHPFYLDDLIFNPGPIHELIEANGRRPVYWTKVPVKNAFEDLFQALSSAVIIPVREGVINALIVLGWSEPQSAEPVFREFIDVVRIRIAEVCRQAHIEQSAENALTLYSALLNTLPEALIFIGAEGHASWINISAARLLNLDRAGELPPASVSGAMANLLQQTTNRDEIMAMAMQLFASPESSMEGMIWEMEHVVMDVSCRAVSGKGKLWQIKTKTYS
ncbi:hypothetical protein [Chitinophaga rhizophila]|uniref:PAS domain-containing protein n=1 Tax=Chitinophaga rhizophila TaxID=2866212 RepID=A0ABS7GA70_9BACT|nr:hypothetical protein [Chitinophaga rhizophila]MBW8684562.1 hypothetical protein [Chitinophaga rhizophila]